MGVSWLLREGWLSDNGLIEGMRDEEHVVCVVPRLTVSAGFKSHVLCCHRPLRIQGDRSTLYLSGNHR